MSPAEWQAREWRKGDRLPEDGHAVIRDPDRYGLPRPGDGYSYCRIDAEVVKAVDATLEIAAGAGAVDALPD